MIERILVPLDGSPVSEAVLPHLQRMVRPGHSEIILLRAVNPLPSFDGYVPLYEAAMSEGRDYLRGIKEKMAGWAIPVHLETRLGPAIDAIAEVAHEQRASLVAMSTHGRKGLARLILGSVAEQVLRVSPVPVLIVHPPDPGEPVLPPKEHPIENILVPLDLTDLSQAILPHVADFASLFGARVVLLHVMPPRTDLEPRPRAPAELRDVAEKFSDRAEVETRLNEMARRFRASGIPVLTLVEQGDPVSAIREACRLHDIDLMAMATHGRTGLQRLFHRSITEQALRETRIPLLAARAAPVEAEVTIPRGAATA